MKTRDVDHVNHYGRSDRISLYRRALGLAPLVGALALAACGNHNITLPAVPNTTLPPGTNTTLPTGPQARAEAPLLAYAQCMRSKGVSAFPDPSTSSAGGIGYSNTQIQGINQNSSSYQAAKSACQNLPGAATAKQLLKPHS